MRRPRWFVFSLVSCLALSIAVPVGAPKPQGELPLLSLWRMVTASYAWAADSPSSPRQARGGAVEGEHVASPETTRANGGNGNKPGAAPGALAAYDPPAPQGGPEWTTPKEQRGFDAATSVRLGAAANRDSDLFTNADGSMTRRVYNAPRNYRMPDGTWQPIDTTLSRGGDGALHADGGPVRLRLHDSVVTAPRSGQLPEDEVLPFTGLAELATVTLPGGQTIGYGLDDAAAVPARVTGSTAQYRNILPYTEVELTATGGGLKETMVLRSPQAPSSWVFPLRLQGLRVRTEAQRSLSLVDDSGKAVAVIPAGSMVDARGVTSDAVKYEVSGGVLRVTADRGWLGEPARAYPVRVDPTIRVIEDADVYVDESAQTGAPEQNGASLAVGLHNPGGKSRTFLAFNDFAGVPGNPSLIGKKLTDANLWLFHNWSPDCAATRPITIHRVLQPWSVNDLQTGAWPGPQISAPIGQYTISNNTPACQNPTLIGDKGSWWFITVDVSTLNDWARGEPNYGLALSASDTDPLAAKRFASRDFQIGRAPYLELTYSDNVAPQIEDQNPKHGAQVQSLTPLLSVSARDPDAWPQALTTTFLVYNKDNVKIADSGPIADSSWRIPVGTLRWGEVYSWTAVVFDGNLTSVSQKVNVLSTLVSQPPVTSTLAQNTEKGFSPSVGNYTTSAVDVQVPSVGPLVSITRSYNSLDTRKVSAFGAGWSTLVDTAAAERRDPDSGGVQTVTITYPNGQEVTFGRNPDGVYTPPPGRFSTLTDVAGGGFNLVDKEYTAYRFTEPTGTTGRFGLSRITDAQGRQMSLQYTDGRVSSMTSASGRRLRLDWATPAGASTPHVAAVRTEELVPGDSSSESVWSYSYSGDSLTGVCPPTSSTQCTAYGYVNGPQHPGAVQNLGARTYWRLNEASGGTANNSILENVTSGLGSYFSVSLGQPGPLVGSTATSAGFNGTSSRLQLTEGFTPGGELSVSMWFKTTTPGRVLLGQTRATLFPGTGEINTGYWPQLYVGSDGTLTGGFPTRYEPGPLGKLTTHGQGMCTDVVGQQPVNGAEMKITTCSAGQTQDWTLDAQERLTVTKDGVTKCVEPRNFYAFWADVVLADCASGNDQKWVVKPDGEIENVQFQMCWVPKSTAIAESVIRLGSCSFAPFEVLTRLFMPSVHHPMRTNVNVTDGQWHHAVLSAAGTTQTLYVDGLARAQMSGKVERANLTRTYAGAGVLGGGWPNQPYTPTNGSDIGQLSFFSGNIAEVSYYDQPLNAAAAAQLFTSNQATQLLNRITQPSGAVTAEVGYDLTSGVVTQVTDAHGGLWKRGKPEVSASSQTYVSTVLGAEPYDYFRLTETGVTVPVNEVNGSDGVFNEVSLGIKGALFKDTTVAAFNGISSYLRLSTKDIPTTAPATVSLWFKVPGGASTGGVLYSYQDTAVGSNPAGSYTPALYVGTDGKLRGRFWSGTIAPITTPGKVNDGLWHHAVLSSTGTSQSLYLDGVTVGTVNGATSAHGANFAYIGAGGWAGSPATFGGTGYFNGQIAEVAYFRRALSGDEAQVQFRANSTVTILSSGRYKGNGTGGLEPGLPKSIPSLQTALAAFPAGDFWRDGGNDYYVIERDGSLTFYISDSSADDGFTEWHSVGGGWSNRESLFSPGDFNGDSTSDVIWRDPANGTLWMSRSLGIDPIYVTPVQVSSANWSNRDIFSPGDFDGDGKADVLYRQYSDNKLYLMRGNGTGGFVTGNPIELQSGWGGRTPVPSRGDWDGDGLSDILFRDNGSGYVYYIKGNGSGGLTGSPIRIVQDFLDAELVFSPGDWDADGKADLLFRRVYTAGPDSNGYPPGFRLKTVKVTDPTNKTITHVFDMAVGGRQIEQTDARAGKTRFGYDIAGFLRSTLDPNGNIVVEEHDVRGNVISRTTCQDRSEERCSTVYQTYFPDATSKVLTPDPRNDVPLTIRDGRSTSAGDDRYKTTLSYDTRGNQTSVTDPIGRATVTEYTDGTTGVPAGLPWRITYPGGAVERISYLPNGDVSETVDKAGLITRFSYDALGRMATMTTVSDSYPAGLVTSFEYDKAGKVKRQTNPAVINRVTGAIHTALIETDYDFDGRAIAQTVSDTTGGDSPRTVLNGYNSRGQLTSITDARGKVRSFTYDLYGNKATETDAAGVTMAYTYDPTGLLLTATVKDWTGDPNNPVPAQDLTVQSRSYDMAGRLASATDAMGWQTRYTYWDDGLPATVSRIDPATPGAVFVMESNSYDPAGNLVSKVTNNGVTTTNFTVDAASRQQSMTTDPTGVNRSVAYTFDLNDTVLTTRLSDGSGREQFIDASYDVAGRQRSQSIRGSANSLSWTLDQRGLQTSVTDSAGHVTGFEYDEAGRLALLVEPSTPAERDGGDPVDLFPVTATGYDTFGAEVETRDPLGRVTVSERDANGEVASVSHPAYTPPGDTEPIVPVYQFRYDDGGQLIEAEDPLHHVTTQLYDQLGRVARITTPDTGVTRLGYNLNGDNVSFTDPEGARREATYDYMGRVATSTLFERSPAAAYTTSYAYHQGGWLSGLTAPGLAEVTYGYNAVGERVRATDGAGNAALTSYDFVGRPEEQTLPDGARQKAGYDAAGHPNLRQQLDAAGTVLAETSATFDGDGRMLTATDARSNTKTYEYNARGQVTRLVEPTSATQSVITAYGHDASGGRTRFTDGRGNRFITTYNAWGDVESEIEPGGAAFVTSYDAGGRPVGRRAPGDVTILNTYDEMGRLIRQAGSGADAVTEDRAYDYDLAGNVRAFTEGTGTGTVSYNDRGMVTSVTGVAGASSFTYDGAGQMLTRTDAAGVSTYTYDPAGRPATVTDASTGELSTYAYNSLSQVESISYPTSGNRRAFTYDERHLPDADELKDGAGQTIAKIDYGFDLNGNEISKTTTGFAGSSTNDYTYDLANRLTSWDDGTAITSYEYDKSGNRTRIGSRILTYNERNQLTGDGLTTYTYTPRGTLAGSTVGTVTAPSTFDAYGQQKSQDTQTYSYDGLGRLLSTGAGAALSYSGLDNTIASDGASTYSRGPDDEVIGVKSGGSGANAWTDLHGDVVGLFTSTGSALGASRSYDPLGGVVAQSGATGALGYQSGWTDPSTGQVNMHSRWYSPGTGQFAARDTATVDPEPKTVRGNRYQYGDGNPLTVSDPTGHSGEFGSDEWHLGMFDSAIRAANWLIDIARRWAPEYVQSTIEMRDWLVDMLGRFKAWIVESAERAARMAQEWAERAAEAARQNAQEAAEAAKRAWDSAATAAKRMIDNVGRFAEESARVLADAYQGVETWVKEHKAEIAGFVVSVAVGVGCGIAIGWTGVGAVVCGVLASAAGSYVTGVMQGKTGWELASDVLLGSLTGLVGGPLGGKAVGAMFRGLGGTRILGSLAKGVVGKVAGKVATGLQTLRGAGARAANVVKSSISQAASRARTGLAKVATNARNVMRQLAGCHSFAASTAVVLADGTSKPISEVKPGDRVRVTDPATGESTARPVTKLHRHTDQDLTEVGVRDGRTGKVSVLKTTSAHPLWNVDKHTWTRAGDLVPGTHLRAGDNEVQTVVSVKAESGEAQMYDLTVEDIHTYYVAAGDQPVLVHNCPSMSWVQQRIVSSEYSVARNADALRRFGRTGFSGVYDPDTGRFVAKVSGEGQLVARNGGHVYINVNDFNNSDRTLGFAIVKKSSWLGELFTRKRVLEIRWSSRGVNLENHGSIEVPQRFRDEIIEAVRRASGFEEILG